MTKRSEKREKLRKLKEKREKKELKVKKESTTNPVSNEKISYFERIPIFAKFLDIYNTKYKLLLAIPILLLIASFILIGYHMHTHDGDFINKDISLKGGVSITIPTEQDISVDELEKHLKDNNFDANIRRMQSRGQQIGYLIESGIDLNDEQEIDRLLNTLSEKVEYGENYSIEGVGAAIGRSFFIQAMIALLFSFILMGTIIAITFRSFFPSIAVIGAALSDIVITVAIVNLMGMKMSTAGIAALLMLIGYSVDTDILLTTRVLKRTEYSLNKRIASAFKTGILMSLTTIIAVTVALIFSTSDVIKQIMTVLLIGLLVDQISTWIQNVSILRIHQDLKESKNKAK